jgi:hypothetical protein
MALLTAEATNTRSPARVPTEHDISRAERLERSGAP